jgi:hypothetical protein
VDGTWCDDPQCTLRILYTFGFVPNHAAARANLDAQQNAWNVATAGYQSTPSPAKAGR